MIIEETSSHSYSIYFYLAIIIPILIIGMIIFFIRKLKYDHKKILKSVWISLLITLILEGLFYVIGSYFRFFEVMCKIGADCPTQFQMFINYFFYSFIAIFLIVIFIYYIIKMIKTA